MATAGGDIWIGCGCGGEVLEVLLSGFIFLVIGIVIDLLQVQLQRAEAFRDHAGPSIQDTAQIRLS